jgi:chemotaxis protein CheD
MAQQIIVGIGDCKWSRTPGDVLVTYALGSCIAVAIHDAQAGVAGLLHYVLPDSRSHGNRAYENPFYFADTGIPSLFKQAYRLGAAKERMVVRLAGGACTLSGEDHFQIGSKNHTAARRILWRAGVLIAAEQVGGGESRTVRLEVDTGRFWWVRPNREEIEIGEPAQICR